MLLLPRRRFFSTSTALLATGALAPSAFAQETKAPPAGATKAPPRPPALPPALVQAVVAAAHRDLAKVRELVAATPLLVNACWDWGGGDFETPLEAAAHTGQRAIAEFLLAHHARPGVFAAAMLGRLDVVKTMIALDPAGHALPGPHGFTLLHCAKQGGDQARPVVDWLVAQGAADALQRPLPYVRPAGTAPN